MIALQEHGRSREPGLVAVERATELWVVLWVVLLRVPPSIAFRRVGEHHLWGAHADAHVRAGREPGFDSESVG